MSTGDYYDYKANVAALKKFLGTGNYIGTGGWEMQIHIPFETQTEAESVAKDYRKGLKDTGLRVEIKDNALIISNFKKGLYGKRY